MNKQELLEGPVAIMFTEMEHFDKLEEALLTAGAHWSDRPLQPLRQLCREGVKRYLRKYDNCCIVVRARA